MMLQLDNEMQVELLSPDITASLEGRQITLTFQGIHNEPLSDSELVARIPFDVEHNARLIGDGFQMLCQTAGTPDKLTDVGRCPDNDASYRIYATNAPKRFYNYLVLEQSGGYTLFGFTSCRRFAGYFELAPTPLGYDIHVHLDGENSLPQEWDSPELENFCVLCGDSLSALYEEYAGLIAHSHPPRAGVNADAPVGWCSWYAYYADVSEENIQANVAAMQDDLESLEWVLLDDGYQAFMGDWLTPSDKFSGGVKELIQSIKAKGKKPAIWMAPFIAQKESQVFQQHPDWFVRHEDGSLLKAEDITYGGWRCTPWYILDTSHPDVQAHLTETVRVMREDWGVELFKLDANYWGTLKGVRYQSGVTGVQAYRMGMEAIAAGAGEAWLLGCNAPMWPSLGLVDAMRVSDDVERNPHRFEQIAKETFYRAWQHRRLWQIDPDCVTLTSLPNQGTERPAYHFHRTALLACGGLLLSGDPLPEITDFAKASFSKLLTRHKHNQNAAKFTSLSLNHAFLRLTGHNDLHCLFNFSQPQQEYTLTSDHPVFWYDFWSGKRLCDEPVQILQVTLPDGLQARAILTADR